MSMITEQVIELREYANNHKGEIRKICLHAANTIEQLAAKVRAETNELQPCEDAISRQAVLDIVDSYSESQSNVEDVTQDIISDIVALPPVNPQYTEDEIQKMQDLEQAEIEKAYELGKVEGQNSEDAISRQAVIDAIDKWVKAEHILETLPTDKVTPLFKSVHKLPLVNPQPKTGQWIDVFGGCECSECGCLEGGYSDYCPNCGRSMIEPQ